ncbi:MAG: 30S ribosomal protein S4 [Methanobacteriota archaeon]
MGKPKFQRRKYDVPLHPWKEERIHSERDLIKKYGLKNHREVWKAKTLLRQYRRQARGLLAKVDAMDPQGKKESNQLLLHLSRMSILPETCTLDDVLSLDTENILSRRLQTLVYHRGFANTIQHARELVSHGHIAIGKNKVTIPGYSVKKDEEHLIGYTEKSPLNALSHPARPKAEVQRIPAVPAIPSIPPKVIPPKKEEEKKPTPQPPNTILEQPQPTSETVQKKEEPKTEAPQAPTPSEAPVMKETKPLSTKKPIKKKPSISSDEKKEEKKQEGNE